MTTPAATSWQKFPGTTVAPPTPSVAPPPQLPAASPPGSRVVVFTKPAGGGEVRPVQATEADKKKDDKPVEPLRLDKGQEVKPTDALRLRTDEELGEEVAAETNLRRQVQYAKDRKAYTEYEAALKEYEAKLERFKLGLEKDEPRKPKEEKKPADPVRLTSKDLELPVFGPAQPAPTVKAGYGPARAVLEPGYVVHRRLFFEEKNSERYGWDLGFAQPFVSAGVFYKDVLFWPSKLTSNFFERYDTSAGKCPPGSPVAYYLYPPNITLKGGLVETAAVLGTIVLMP